MAGTGRMRMLPILATLLLAGCTRGMTTKNSELRAASALFTEFETVFYSKPELISSSGAYKPLSKQDAGFLRLPFVDLQMGLDTLGGHASADILKNSSAILVGTKNYRPPIGLGSVQSQYCYIIVFGKWSTFDLRKSVSQAPEISAPAEAVWKWSAPPQEGHPQPYTFYMAQVPHSYVIVSNDRQELQTVAGLLASSHDDTGSLGGIPEWQSVSQDDYWGYRRYRQDGVVDRNAAGMSEVTPSAEALIFSADFQNKKAVLRLLASDDSTAAKMNAAMTKATAALSPLKPSGTGVWETTIPFAGDRDTGERMFEVMWLFGFGVYL
jgi:hypothetical protein